jgi:hypothetical protein
MANTKKVTEVTESKEEVKKDTASVLEKINESVDSISDNITIQPKTRKSETTISNEEEIACKSVTFGGLTWVSPKTNSHYRWADIGATEYIPFGELVTLNNTKRNYLFKPMFIVQDERVIKYFRLQEVYENVARIHTLKELFDTSDMKEIENTIDIAIRVNMRDVIISKVRDMRKTGELVNINIIKLLEEKLCFDLSEDDTK